MESRRMVELHNTRPGDKFSVGDLIFTDCGVSGPFIYKLTSYNAYKNFPYEFEIPLLDTEKLKEEVK